jgi:hypothetical protein
MFVRSLELWRSPRPTSASRSRASPPWAPQEWECYAVLRGELTDALDRIAAVVAGEGQP